jgi:protein ImuB
VLRPQAEASHSPERASLWRPDGDGAVRPDPRRPLLMLERPEPVEAVSQLPDGPPRLFVWRKMRHRIARAEGPERIAPEWWRDGQGARLTRDYFRFFLFRDGLQGRETDAPRWFLCGAG